MNPSEPTRIRNQNITLALVEELARDPENGHAARRLAERGAQALAYGCTSASYVLGPEGDAAIIDGDASCLRLARNDDLLGCR